MIELFKRHLDDHGEQVQRYGYIGVMTTLVGLSTFWVMKNLVGVEINIANALSVVFAVLFGYIANKHVVFRSSNQDLTGLFMEFIRFMGSRTVTISMEVIFFSIGIRFLDLPPLIIKGAVSAVVFVLNYVVSHYFVFQNSEQLS